MKPFSNLLFKLSFSLAPSSGITLAREGLNVTKKDDATDRN